VKKTFLTAAVISALALFQSTQALAATQNDLHHVLYDTEFNDSECSGAAANGSTPLTGSGNVQEAFNFFVLKGLTADQAAGIVGNMIEESAGVNPQEVQGGGTNPDPTSTSGGWGIVQWTPGSAVVSIAKTLGIDSSNSNLDLLKTQLEIVWEEMNGQDTAYQANMMAAMKATTNVNAQDSTGSTYVFESQFEKAGAPALAVRIADAEQVLKQYGGSAPTGPVSQSGPCSNSNSIVNAAGCSNPWAKASNLSPERIDMGVDYNANAGSPILAICPGVVIGAAAGGTGWVSPENTQACVYVKINAGTYTGKTYYFCEDIVPTVHTGQTVTAGQEIATFKASSTGLESGWGSGTPYGPLAASLNQECMNGDPGCWSSAAGVSFNKLIIATGGKGGVYVPGAPPQHMPGGYP
jgi:murein DD-endopeptidase MepM/ murein hydrolase activator NlpD